jgi:hypothetical protein
MNITVPLFSVDATRSWQRALIARYQIHRQIEKSVKFFNPLNDNGNRTCMAMRIGSIARGWQISYIGCDCQVIRLPPYNPLNQMLFMLAGLRPIKEVMGRNQAVVLWLCA